MRIYSPRGALIILLCLLSVFANATAAVVAPTPAPSCTPVQQPAVAPGDVINLKGPDVSADQAALGITWDYQWTVQDNDANGKIEQQSTGQSLAFTVPTTGYANNYYISLMVTAHQATLCINQACMTFPIVAAGQCTITTNQPTQICVSDTGSYTYSTAATPSSVNQRWWIFPFANLPSDLSKLGYNDQSAYKVGDGSSITVNWNTQSGGNSGTYVIVSAYYAKKSPYAYQSSCQMRVVVVGVPSSTITVQ